MTPVWGAKARPGKSLLSPKLKLARASTSIKHPNTPMFGSMQLLAVASLLLAVVGANRTPLELERYFLESCSDVLRASTDADGTCISGWLAFMNSFANRDPTSMSIGDYAPYYEAIPLPERITDELLLWSRTERLKESLVRLQDINVMCSYTIAASDIVNRMREKFSVTTWCGKLNGGIDYNNSCPDSEPGTPVYTFFAEFSVMLGKRGAGVVFYLTNAGHYCEEGFFGQYELPNLLSSSSLSTRLVVLNVVPINQSSHCGEGALVELEARIRSERPELQYVCYNVTGNADIITQPLLDQLVNIIEEEQQHNAASGVGEYSHCQFIPLRSVS